MKKNPHTAWFNLENYEPFKTMSTADWIWQLEARASYRRLFHDQPELVNKKFNVLSSLETTLSISGVIPEYSEYQRLEERQAELLIAEKRTQYPFSTASVNSLTSYEIWSMTENDKLKHVWDVCMAEQDYGWDDPSSIGNTPHDLHTKHDSRLDSVRMAHVTINLSATDKQILKDLKHWLTNYRKAVNYQSQNRLFNQTQTKFDYWIKFRIIPYLDLVLVAKIKGQKISQNDLAHLLFLDDQYEVDIVDRLQKVTIPEAKQVIKNEIHKTLSTQLAHMKGCNEKSIKSSQKSSQTL